MIKNQGKFIFSGSMSGLLFAGPLGALFGGLIGYHLDELFDRDHTPSFDNTSDSNVHNSITALSAKLTQNKKHVTEIFGILVDKFPKRSFLFDQIRADKVTIDHYAYHLADTFKQNPREIERILDKLFKLCIVDGVIAQNEIDYLENLTCNLFRFSLDEFEQIKSVYTSIYPVTNLKPYEVIGLAKTATDDEIKARYKHLIQEHHPDKLMSLGLPQDAIDEGTEKVAHINVAYHAILTSRSKAKERIHSPT